MSEYITHKDKIILSLIEKYSQGNIKVLDVGAGNNLYWKEMPKNIKYFSLDINPKYNPSIIANLEDELPIRNKIYDIIIASEVLEHTINPKEVIKELKRITKENGFIIISMPNEYNFYLRLKFLFGIQNNTEIPFRKELYKNHIHKARVKDLLDFYNKEFKVIEIRYSWDSFSNNKFLQKVDIIIHYILMPLSKSLFSRSVIMIGERKCGK